MSLEILNLSLKNSPNSDFFLLEFGETQPLSSKIEKKNMSLEILHLSWRILQTQFFFDFFENFPNAF